MTRVHAAPRLDSKKILSPTELERIAKLAYRGGSGDPQRDVRQLLMHIEQQAEPASTSPISSAPKEPTAKMLCQMAYELRLVPQGEMVCVQFLDILRNQYKAAMNAAMQGSKG